MSDLDRVRRLCDLALADGPALDQFIERLQSSSVGVSLPTGSNPDGSEALYHLNDATISGTELGFDYTMAGLIQRGLQIQVASPSVSSPAVEDPATSDQMVRDHLQGFGCDRVEILLRSNERAKTLHRIGTVNETIASISWLHSMNAVGHSVYVRPSDYRSWILLDDLSLTELPSLYEHGFEPALVLETTPGRGQVWLKLATPEPISEEARAVIAQYLAQVYKADETHTEAHHYGLLAGFYNHHPKLHLPTGSSFLVVLRDSTGRVMSEGARLAEQADRFIDQRNAKRMIIERTTAIRSWAGPAWTGWSSKHLLGPADEYRRLAQSLGIAFGTDLSWPDIDRRIASDLVHSGRYPIDAIIQAIREASPHVTSAKPSIVEAYAQQLVNTIVAEMDGEQPSTEAGAPRS